MTHGNMDTKRPEENARSEISGITYSLQGGNRGDSITCLFLPGGEGGPRGERFPGETFGHPRVAPLSSDYSIWPRPSTQRHTRFRRSTVAILSPLTYSEHEVHRRRNPRRMYSFQRERPESRVEGSLPCLREVQRIFGTFRRSR